MGNMNAHEMQFDRLWQVVKQLKKYRQRAEKQSQSVRRLNVAKQAEGRAHAYDVAIRLIERNL